MSKASFRDLSLPHEDTGSYFLRPERVLAVLPVAALGQAAADPLGQAAGGVKAGVARELAEDAAVVAALARAEAALQTNTKAVDAALLGLRADADADATSWHGGEEGEENGDDINDDDGGDDVEGGGVALSPLAVAPNRRPSQEDNGVQQRLPTILARSGSALVDQGEVYGDGVAGNGFAGALPPWPSRLKSPRNYEGSTSPNPFYQKYVL